MSQAPDIVNYDALLAEIAAALLAYQHGDESHRTESLRRAAQLLVSSRAHFQTREGRPDWGGRTGAYRLFAGTAFNLARLFGDDRTRVSAALRYHYGDALRELLGVEKAVELGFVEKSPKERARAARAAHRKRFEGLVAAAAAGTGMESVVELVQRIGDEIDALKPELIRSLSDSDRATIRDVAGEMVMALADVRGATA